MKTLRLVALAVLSGFAPAQDGPDLFVSPRRQALVIGAQEYVDDVGALSYAARDSSEVAKLLEERYGFEVELLHDGERESGELQSDYEARLPTASVIHQALSKITNDPSRRGTDLFVFYFCGHGENRDGVGDVLLPTDTRAGSSDRLAITVKDDVLVPLQEAGMDNVLLLIDACREGGDAAFGRELVASSETQRSAILLGCGPGGRSYEEAGFGHGTFTHVLLQALKSDRLADAAGGLWFSRLAADVKRGVAELSVRREPLQEPVAVFDPRRDILLGAVPEVSAMVERLEGLSSQAAQAAILTAAGDLMSSGRGEEALPLIRVAEQLGDVSSGMLLNLAAWHSKFGDAASAARHYAQVRDRDEGEFAQLATALDDSGQVTLARRAEAARTLVGTTLRGDGDHAIVMMNVLAEAGDFTSASLMAEAMAEIDPDSRPGALMKAYMELYRGDVDKGYGWLVRAEEIPGLYPSDMYLMGRRFEMLLGLGHFAQAEALAREAMERWPESGSWRLSLARLVRDMTDGHPDGREAIHAEVGQALKLSLGPEEVLVAVQLDLQRIVEYQEDLERWAETYPLAWRPALAAALVVEDSEELAARVEAAIGLAPNPNLARLTALRLSFDAAFDSIPTLDQAVDRVALRQKLQPFVYDIYSQTQAVLGHMGEEPEAWSLYADVAQYAGDYEGFLRKFEEAFGDRIDRKRVPVPLVFIGAPFYLATGRHERFQLLRDSLTYDSLRSIDLQWAEAAFLTVVGDDALAKAMLAGDFPLPRGDWKELELYLAAYLASKDKSIIETEAYLSSSRRPGDAVFPFLALIQAEWGEWGDFEQAMSMLDNAYVGEGLFVYVRALFLREGVESLNRVSSHMPGMPLTRAVRIGDKPLEGELRYRIAPINSAPLLGVGEWQLSLIRGGESRVFGELTSPDEQAVWTLRGTTMDEFGNLHGRLKSEGGELKILAKIASDPALLPDGYQQLVLYGQNGERFNLYATPIE